MRKVSQFNDGWFCNDRPAQLPHTVTELPLNYFDETLYQGPARYTKTFQFDPSWEGYEVSLHFEAAMANVGDFAEEVFGTWGTDWQGVTIKGYRDGDAVASRAFVADPLPSTLEVAPDRGGPRF